MRREGWGTLFMYRNEVQPSLSSAVFTVRNAHCFHIDATRQKSWISRPSGARASSALNNVNSHSKDLSCDRRIGYSEVSHIYPFVVDSTYRVSLYTPCQSVLWHCNVRPMLRGINWLSEI
jgi:hypothetical protein